MLAQINALAQAMPFSGRVIPLSLQWLTVLDTFMCSLLVWILLSLLISVYKHNESLAVNQGDLVVSGEVIGFAGSTGILSTGPHLHLELWSDGYPINPTELIEFE